MRSERPAEDGNSDSEVLIKSESAERQGHFNGHRKSNSNRKRNEIESGKVGTAGKGKRESEELESENCEARFDRESDTKESDRVGNARPKGSARRKAP
ncbi:hypothetical protein, partial [Streptomyces sp. NPDC048669]|uniref:hypothetical protein n=1 Tax=Streptomyces sp. NPDC048669 TaxID=3155267 RepID=UPI00342DC667